MLKIRQAKLYGHRQAGMACRIFLLLVWVSIDLSHSAVWATPPVGDGRPALSLTQLTVKGGEVIEQRASLKVPSTLSKPVLIVYLPATLDAKDQAMKLVEPIKQRPKLARLIRFISLLDLSAAAFGTQWIVKRAYRSDRLKDPEPSIEFWWSEDERALQPWGLPSTKVRYTLYHPEYPPLSGEGQPTKDFIREVLSRIGSGKK